MHSVSALQLGSIGEKGFILHYGIVARHIDFVLLILHSGAKENYCNHSSDYFYAYIQEVPSHRGIQDSVHM